MRRLPHLARRPRPRFLPAATPALVATLALVAAAFTGARDASAQTAANPPTAQGFALDRFNPSSPGSDWFALDSLDLRGSGRPALRVGLDWGERPLVLYDQFDREIMTVLQRQVLLHVGFAINIAGRVRLGVNMPFAVSQKSGSDQAVRVNGLQYPTVEGANPGDLRAALDIRLFGEGHGPFTIAVGAEGFFPTGKQESFLGEGRVRIAPHLALAGDIGIFSYAVRGGVMLNREEIGDVQLGGVGQGQEAFGGVAIGLRPIPEVLIGPEVYGSSVITDANFGVLRATPVEAILGAHFTLGKDFHLNLGGGPGLTRGSGSPQIRGLASLEYFPAMPPSDRDHDRIIDVEDACPDEPGPRTGDPKTNGCPPPVDRDADGVIDLEDACPDVPGERTNDPQTNGCPPPKDTDKDGIMDPEDACPEVPGVKTDDPKTNGCPSDRDKDTILDADDACPDKAGDKNDNPKLNGCPDTDKDGIYDPEDACPEQPGPRDPDPKKNGCPVARVVAGQVVITQQVKFKTGSAIILPESDFILEAVAKVLTDHAEIKKVRVEGHTDNRGGRAYNRGLSNKRAASVVKWLVQRGGIDPARLTSQGFGFDRPIATNMTDEGRRENRRVEFHITDPAPTPEAAPPQ